MTQINTEKKKDNVKQNVPLSPSSGQVSTGISFTELKKDTDVLLMLYPKDIKGNFSQSIDPEDEITVYDLIKNKNDFKENLLIVLDTSGGNVYSAVKMMDTLRTKYKNITIAVPQEAKSSGTMMCCGADKIIMSSISELGPLDKPMMHPNDETSVISALDIIKSIDGMIEKALDDHRNYSFYLKNENGIPLKKSFEIAGDMVSKLISPMLCREDVKIYNQARRLLVIAEVYASEFLNKYMFKYIDDGKIKKRVVDAVVRQLVWSYPDHAFAIRREELKEWLFLVDEAENLPYWSNIWKEFENNIGKKEKVIRYI